MEGNPPQCPLNLSTSIRTCNRRVEVERIIRLFKSLGHALKHMSLGEAMMRHIHQGWLSNGAPHREAFPSGLSLQIPRFLSSYKYRGSTPFGLLFGLFCSGVFPSFFAPSSSLRLPPIVLCFLAAILRLVSSGFLLVKERSLLTPVSFPPLTILSV